MATTGSTKRARRAAPPIRGYAGAWMARLARATRYVDPKLIELWPSLVGEEMASLCRPGRVSGGRRERTLEVFVTNGAAAAAVRFEESRLILKINEYMGVGAVGRLLIRQSGGAPETSQPALPSDPPTQNNAGPSREAPRPSGGLSRFRAPTPSPPRGQDDDDVPF